MHVDMGKVTDLEKRNEAARLYEASRAADRALDAAVKDNYEAHRAVDDKYGPTLEALDQQRWAGSEAIADKYAPQLRELRQKRDAEITAANEEINGRVDELRRKRDAEYPFAALEAAAKAAKTANNDFDAPCLDTDENGDVVCCALSGVPLFEDDEVVEDSETGEKILRVLVLPPRPSDEDDEDEGGDDQEAA